MCIFITPLCNFNVNITVLHICFKKIPFKISFYLFPFAFLDEFLIRSKAIDLVDSVLEQSVQYLSSHHQQNGQQTLRFSDHTEIEKFVFTNVNQIDNNLDQHPALNANLGDYFLHSDSENFAITCDLSNDAEILKSPTIESISGKSFDENMSPRGEHDPIGLEMHILKEQIELDNTQTFADAFPEMEIESREIYHSDFDKTIDAEDASQLQINFSPLGSNERLWPTTDPNLTTPELGLHKPKGDLAGSL